MISLSRKFSTRLTLWYALAFAGLLGIAFAALFFTVDKLLDNRIVEDLEEDIVEFRHYFAAEGLDKVKSQINRETAAGSGVDVFFRLLRADDGKVLYNSRLDDWREIHKFDTTMKNLQTDSPEVFFPPSLEGRQDHVAMVYGYIAPDLILQIGETIESKTELMYVLGGFFLLVFLIVLPLALIVVWYMSQRAARGIEEVSRTASAIQAGQMNKRVNINAHGDEIDTLANTFNGMLDRIADLVNGMREMTDNIAHDLRSPLARIRVISESVLSTNADPDELRSAASDTVEECDRMLHMINTTLDVAEAEAGVARLDLQELDLLELVTDSCELYETVAAERGLSLHSQVAGKCRIYGDFHSLQRTIANLIDNALKYTPKGGQVHVSLTCGARDVRVTVSDNGMGISPNEQSRIFERFYRGDRSRTEEGCGLGLSFSRAVIMAHHGTISVKSEEHEGSEFSVTLPVHQMLHGT